MEEKESEVEINRWWPLIIVPQCRAVPDPREVFPEHTVFATTAYKTASIEFNDGSPFEEDPPYNLRRGAILRLTVRENARGRYFYEVTCSGEAEEISPEDRLDPPLLPPSIIIRGTLTTND